MFKIYIKFFLHFYCTCFARVQNLTLFYCTYTEQIFCIRYWVALEFMNRMKMWKKRNP